MLASACTFGLKIDSTKARQYNGRCDLISRDFAKQQSKRIVFNEELVKNIIGKR